MNKIGNQLVGAIKDGEFNSVTVDVMEAAIDGNLPESFLREIPLLSIVIGSLKTTSALRDRLFSKKLLTFLYELKPLSKEDILDEIIKLEDDNKYKTKVGEKLLYIIDRCEDMDKASLTGTLFKAFLEKKLDYDEFLSATNIIERTPLPDLLSFINEDFEALDLDNGGSEYVSYGLMEIFVSIPKIKISGKDVYIHHEYEMSEDEMLQKKIKLENFEIEARATWLARKLRQQLRYKA